jgi:Tfp pilus assembly protein PilX
MAAGAAASAVKAAAAAVAEAESKTRDAEAVAQQLEVAFEEARQKADQASYVNVALHANFVCQSFCPSCVGD